MSTRGREPAIYRVNASGDRWAVFREPEAEPLALFADRPGALSYAMSLARGRADWQLFEGRRGPGRRGSGLGNLPQR
jgi:hypothetical protein